ncbi:flagellar protein FlaG [Spectribacter hydrogenoxidans]|uniref:Flagellar protein FlaG n=1 Tax=Spectribacter hydrogenoxidans TaxID=3075608 RepID=A0ABU3BVR9_9GAMM|nr:flagellar protein FlaG [Salinisphaera sp. W335]MDT0633392.1 flagellar protein FlaG [Salinisphaera sp. W335]
MTDSIEPLAATDWHRPWRDPRPLQNGPLAAPKAGAGPAESELALGSAVAMINADLVGRDTALRFQMDDTLNRVIVSVIDEQTGDVLRQLPPEEVLSVARRLAAGDARLLDAMA